MPRASTSSSAAYELGPHQVRGVVRPLLDWYASHRRTLPWRDDGDPYRVWVSEVMLQQTRVDVVVDYFARFMERFPSLQILAQAEEAEVLQMWKGLGYYSRARRLLAGARYCVEHHGGQLPASAAELQGVPGIGPYSAGAISSIAFGQPSALVDGNVIRVLSRVFGLRGDPARMPLKKGLWRVAEQLVPETAPGDFNQGLMELGALVCTPQKPQCHACPLRRPCRALAEGTVEELPELAKKAGPERLTMVALLLRARGRIAVQTLAASARWWAGLDALPFARLDESEADAAAIQRAVGEVLRAVTVPSPGSSAGATAPPKKPARRAPRGAKSVSPPQQLDLHVLPALVHSVTRHRIRLVPVEVRLPPDVGLVAPYRWHDEGKVAELSLPAPHQKLLSQHLRP